MLRRRIVRHLALLALAVSGSASAHNAWLLPSSTQLAHPATITVDAAVANDLFFFNHVPLRLDSLDLRAPDGSSLAAENPHRGKLRSVFDLKIDQPGSYRLAALNRGLFASYKLHGETRRWRGAPEELATKIPAEASELKVSEMHGRIETWVTLGKPSQPPLSGQGIELQAVTHPNDLFAGEAARFILTIDGAPAAGVKIEATRGATRYRNQLETMHATTASDGSFAFTWPVAGMYWLHASTSDAKTSHPQAGERRLSYSLTLEVMPE